jgi:hypothetical protein
MESFRSGRDFAAWLGLVPRQHSTGGRQRLGRISKAGRSDIRKLLISGAMSRLNWIGRRAIRPGSWLARMLERKPKMLVAIALANKMARTAWAMTVKGETYRDPGADRSRLTTDRLRIGTDVQEGKDRMGKRSKRSGPGKPGKSLEPLRS